MCSRINPNCECGNDIISFIEIILARTKCVRVYFACTKRFFNLSAEATINVLRAQPQIRCPNLPSINNQNRFSWSVTEGFIFLKGDQNQFQILMETSFDLVSFVSKERNLNRWMVLQQLGDSFVVLENVEPGSFFTNFLLCYKSTSRRQKQTKHAFSLLKKLKLFRDKDLFIIVPFQSTKYRIKELCMNNSWQETKKIFLANM